jgi:PTS system ascorbate-specific IIC component
LDCHDFCWNHNKYCWNRCSNLEADTIFIPVPGFLLDSPTCPYAALNAEDNRRRSNCIGHTSASVALIGAFFGKILGNKEQDSESLQLPKGLEFLRDSNVIIALIMSALYLIGALLLHGKTRDTGHCRIESTGGRPKLCHIFPNSSIPICRGIAIVLFGVRMLVGEIVPAFKGLADTIVPNAKPALDCPIVYPYAPTASILGFVGSFVGALIWLVVLGKTVGYIFVPTMIVLFFHSATAGVFGNATGGVRGALIAGFVTATVVAWGQYMMVTFLINSTIPDTAMWAARQRHVHPWGSPAQQIHLLIPGRGTFVE